MASYSMKYQLVGEGFDYLLQLGAVDRIIICWVTLSLRNHCEEIVEDEGLLRHSQETYCSIN